MYDNASQTNRPLQGVIGANAEVTKVSNRRWSANEG